MQTLFPTKPSTATVVLLATSVLLAIVGVGGVASGAAGKSVDAGHRAARSGGYADSTTTTTPSDSATATSLGVATTVKSTVTTSRSTATTTGSSGPTDCSATPTTANPGGEQPPAVGTYTYVSCMDTSSTTDVKVAAGKNSAGVTRREITASRGEFGTVTATTSYGSAGILQERIVIQSQAATLDCDWKPDIVEYPLDISVGKAWTADSRCEAPTPYGTVTIHATATRKVTDRVVMNIVGVAVTAWVVDSRLKLEFGGGPPTRPISGAIDETSLSYFDPTRGIEVYDKSTSEGSGDFAYPKTTVEQYLKSLTPAR